MGNENKQNTQEFRKEEETTRWQCYYSFYKYDSNCVICMYLHNKHIEVENKVI